MGSVKLFFATNRNHLGKDRWNPKGYGKKFSKDGHENLRFGELSIDFDDNKVNSYLNKNFDGNRIGDGEGLSDYFSKQAKNAVITAYQDDTAKAKEAIPSEKNSSTRFFRNLKKVMMDTTDVVLNIHGYNVSWEEAVGGAIALQFMLNSKLEQDNQKVTVVLFSWPSNGSMMPFAAYKSDRTDARDSGKAVGRAMLKLRDYLGTLKKDAKKEKEQLCNQDIHLLCHSMGNYLLQKAIENKFEGYHGSYAFPRIFKQIFLCAADVKDDVLEGNNGLSRLHEMASNITVYYNNGDTALHISEYTKNLSERLGQVGNAHPALVHNKVHQVDCSPIVTGFVEHSYYLWATVNEDIAQSIAGLSFYSPQRHRNATSQNREWIMK